MLGTGFVACGETQDSLLGIAVREGNYLGDARLAICESSGLIERDGVQVGHGLEMRATFDQDPSTCAVANGSADRGWSSQSRCAGTRNQKHGKDTAWIPSHYKDERG